MTKVPYEDYHEIWWIHSRKKEDWAGLRLAAFRKTVNGVVVVFIQGELSDRIGIRIWDDIKDREDWAKVKQIFPPTKKEALEAHQ